jgi:hypothetical protein
MRAQKSASLTPQMIQLLADTTMSVFAPSFSSLKRCFPSKD